MAALIAFIAGGYLVTAAASRRQRAGDRLHGLCLVGVRNVFVFVVVARHSSPADAEYAEGVGSGNDLYDDRGAHTRRLQLCMHAMAFAPR